MKDASDGTIRRIEERHTIPRGGKQSVVFTATNPCNTIVFENSYWQNNVLQKRIYVFDTDFMYKNIFSGLSIIENRETKENFTDFIIGNEGVTIAQDLESKKRSLKKAKDEMSLYVPASQTGKKDSEIEKYVSIQVSTSAEDLFTIYTALSEQIEEADKKKKNRGAILDNKGMCAESFIKADTLRSQISELNQILAKTYHISDNVIFALEKHISENMSNYSKSKSWLGVGITQICSDNKLCPFCGQDLHTSELYKQLEQYFNNDFQKYIKDVQDKLDGIDINWDVMTLSSLIHNERDFFVSNIQNLSSSFLEYDDKFKHILSEAKTHEEALNAVILQGKKDCKLIIDNKKTVPQNVVNFDCEDLEQKLADYQAIASKFDNLLKEINASLVILQTEVKEGKIDNNLKELNQKSNDLQVQIKRVEETVTCEEWKKRNIAYKKLENEIKVISNNLERNQNDYLNAYFDRISTFFKKFGAKDYKITRGASSNKGYKKVFGINVLFRNTPVTDITSSIFSESDRRALALAIFVAKIEGLSDIEKKNTIIVFDDPATSFDDGRIKTITNILFDLSQVFEQILIFAHHFNFVRNIFLTHKNETSFFKIDRLSANNFGIFDLDPKEVFGSEFGVAFSRIMRFNESQSSDITINDLRIFMETYLDTAFAKHYTQNNLEEQKFGERIEKYREMGCISKDVAMILHGYRQSLNPESHQYTGTQTEDIRTFSIELIDFLFSKIKME
jgi:wobble nucleotide-excising tRNase